MKIVSPTGWKPKQTYFVRATRGDLIRIDNLTSLEKARARALQMLREGAESVWIYERDAL
jgi:hypothetical protein